MNIKSDFLVIGSGIAGLTFALKAAEKGTVTLVTKGSLSESATFYAQGGIASVFAGDDSFESHIKDTITVGDGLSKSKVVEAVIKGGPERIKELMELGVKFTEKSGTDNHELDLGKEGGHSNRRIVHAEDFTGRAVSLALIKAVKEHSNISIYEEHLAADLITHTKFVDTRGYKGEERVWGAYVLDKYTSKIHTMTARFTVLATGGAGKVYLYTSNPDIATGDGIAMAYRGGAEVSNMEFVQFHPTCLFHRESKRFLISEALRGEGAVLKLIDGTPFMKKYHELGDLAPRDTVARAIDFELKRTGDDYVHLDISFKEADFIRTRFPNIYSRCLEYGFDITKAPIPVVPAAHYTCGGISTDLEGRSTLKGLYAIGESAYTGLHGANRLASNSLLESLVFAESAVRSATDSLADKVTVPTIPEWEEGGAVISDEAVVISHNWDEIRRMMWNYVGIVRSKKRLERARRRIDLLISEIDEYYWDFKVTSDLLELRNIATVADLIISSAMIRGESRGLNYNIDYPEKSDEYLKDTTLTKSSISKEGRRKISGPHRRSG